MATPTTVSDDERRALVTHRHRLIPSRRTDDLPELVKSLVALHSSDPATVYLSAMVRMATPSPEAIDGALYDARQLLRHHAMRRTIWVFTPDLARAAHHSTTRSIAQTERQRFVGMLVDNGIEDAESWISAAAGRVEAEIDAAGTMLTRDLGAALPDLAIPLTVQGATIAAHTRLLLVLGIEGRLARARPVGSWISSQYRWSTMASWLPGVLSPMPVDEAAVTLVAAYLDAFGPATFNDLTWWTGWTKTKMRGTLADLGAVRVQLVGGTEAFVGPGTTHAPVPAPETSVAFLPSLDPTTMGWKERSWYLRPEDVPLLFDRNGNAGPTVWVDGRIVGGWAQRPDGEIAYDILDQRARSHLDVIEAEANRLREMYSDIRHKIRFPTPMQRRLIEP